MGYYTHKTIRFLVPASIGVDISSPLAAPPDYPLIGPTAFIVLPERSSDLDYIRRSYPNGSLELVMHATARLSSTVTMSRPREGLSRGRE